MQTVLTFVKFCVLIQFCKNVYADFTDAPECVFRATDLYSPSTTDPVLSCKIRTISSLDDLITNISKSVFDKVISLNVECSDILFFESTLTTQQFKYENKLMSSYNLKELEIVKCKLKEIPKNAFRRFNNLKRLRIKTFNSEWAAMTMELNDNCFSGLNELNELDLTDNNIWSTNSSTFCQLYSLKSLNLSNNHMQNINTLGFSDMPGEPNSSVKNCHLILEVLDISKNDLIVIPDNGLSKLRYLYKLFLQENAISSIDENAFSGLNELLILNLSSNFLSSIPPDLFLETKNLHQIYLSNNTLSVLPPGVFDGLVHLQILDLSFNKITSDWINQGLFDRLPRLVILNLSWNSLSKIDDSTFKDLYSLQVLNLEKNKINHISKHSFSGLRNLHALTMSHNNLIHLHSDVFSDLHVLHQLFIDNNNIRKIDLTTFDNMTSLEDLVLSDNNLLNVPEAIIPLRSLKSLDLGNNNITLLRRDNFLGLSELFGLRLVDNKIDYISHETFEHLPSLQVLNLASNKIKHIDKKCFHKNINLKLIRIDGNKITNFNGVFDSLQSLAWLNMSDNELVEINFKNFPSSLEWLDLHKNYIRSINSDDVYVDLKTKYLDLSFNNIFELTVTSIPRNVEKLHLHNNDIEFIQVGTFSKLQKLVSVTLNDNKLTKLDINAFRIDNFSEDVDLPEFYVSGNPFHCDCSLEWLQRINYLSHSRQYPRVLDLDKATCSHVYTRGRANKMIIDMSPSDFLCPYESHCFALCHCCDFDACDCEMICPSNCTCYHDITWTTNVVDCSNAGYIEVPQRIPMDATEIYLDGNQINYLNSHVFIGKKKLEVLFLNNTNLNEVNNQTFKGVESLRILHLENNRLEELRGDEFNQLTNLKELYLDHNAIARVGNNTFSSMKSLSVLRIDENKLVNFSPWQLLASATQNAAHVYLEGNKWSCDCNNIVKLEGWLRNKSGDPEKMFCSDTEGKPTVTIASIISRCKEYMNDGSETAVMKNQIMSHSLFFTENYITLISGVIMILILILLLAALFYAFRFEISDWAYTKYGIPLFKDQSCTNVECVLDGNVSLYEYYIINNSNDSNFVYNNIVTELECRRLGVKKVFNSENSFNLITLETFSKVSKPTKRLLVIITINFLENDLNDIHFRNVFFNYLKSLSRIDMNKVIFIKLVDGNQIVDSDLNFILGKFKSVCWCDARFWEIFSSILSCTDTMITVKGGDKKVFRNGLGNTQSLRYTTMPVSNENSSKQIFTNSLKFVPNDCGLPSSGVDSSYGEGDDSCDTYMSIESGRTCPKFNYNHRTSPNSNHVYSQVDQNVLASNKARKVTTPTSMLRTYFV